MWLAWQLGDVTPCGVCRRCCQRLFLLPQHGFPVSRSEMPVLAHQTLCRTVLLLEVVNTSVGVRVYVCVVTSDTEEKN